MGVPPAGPVAIRGGGGVRHTCGPEDEGPLRGRAPWSVWERLARHAAGRLLGAGLGAGGAVLALEGVQQLLALGAGPGPWLGGLLAPGENKEGLAPPPQLHANSGRKGIKEQYLCQQKTFAERLNPPAEARPPPAGFSRYVSPGPRTPVEQTSGRGGAGPTSLGVPSSPPWRGWMRVLGTPGAWHPFRASAGQEAGHGGWAARDRRTPVGGLEPTLPSVRGSLADLISILLGAHFPVGDLSARPRWQSPLRPVSRGPDRRDQWARPAPAREAAKGPASGSCPRGPCTGGGRAGPWSREGQGQTALGDRPGGEPCAGPL